IGCHLCSLLLNIPQSTVSGIITKWKQLRTTATEPRSGRPCKMTEWGQHMLKCSVHRSRQMSAESIAKDLQTLCGLQISRTTVCRELHAMGFFGRVPESKPYITKLHSYIVAHSGVKHATTGLQSNEDVFSGVINH
ncbi:unnamed protein product, partial [Staurois parvus]